MSTSMQCIAADDYDQLSRIGAGWIAAFLGERPDVNLVVATGNTPMGIYRELAERRRAGTLDTSGIRVFQLDEYAGLPPDDRRSLFGWTMRSFVAPLGIPATQVHRILDDTSDPEAACVAYDKMIDAAGGIDLAILGLGPNGHLGFNEPPAGPDLPTRAVDLTSESIESNGVYWGGPAQVPLRAVTLGMSKLLAARRILLVVSGSHKREILARTMTTPPTPQVPASFLQEAPNVTVLADREAWGAAVGDTTAAS